MQIDDTPPSDQLRQMREALEKQAARFLHTEQELVNARDHLDRDLVRIKAIHRYCQQAIGSESLEEFGRITAEAIIETFDLERSVILLFETNSGTLKVLAAFGFGERLESGCHMGADWAPTVGPAPSVVPPIQAFITKIEPSADPWYSLGMGELIACPYYAEDGSIRGFLVGGISRQKLPFYGRIDEELLPSFSMFTQQMKALLNNLLARGQLKQTNRDLERRLDELSLLHGVGTAITSITDPDKLLATVLQMVVKELGYDEAVIMLFDQERKVLCNARAASGKEDLIANLEISVGKDDRGLSHVVLSGEPSLVADPDSGKLGVDSNLLLALDARSLFAVPLKAGERVVGILAVDRRQSGEGLTQEETSMLGTLASEVAVSLENIRLARKLARSERLSAIGEVAAGIAHEIRNPLSAIGTLVDILATQTNETNALVLKGINEESRRLQSILTELLNYATPYAPECAPGDINLILEEVASLLARDERYPRSSIERRFDATIGDLSVDGDKMKQVFWNILLNAFQAMPDGGTVQVSTLNCGAYVEVMIVDQGLGIPEKALSRIFEPFYSTKRKGTGLGLPIAEKIIKAHCGTIRVDSKVACGTRVRVTLPR